MSSHAFDTKFIKKHKPASGTEGGRCLNSHTSAYSKTACSYRYQAREQALSESSLYNLASRPSWHVKGSNFTKDAEKPYPHNAHHIIPDAVLRDTINAAIDEVAQSDPDKAPRLRILIRGGLLEAEYNLNHKINMIILPLEAPHAALLKLPRHVVTSKNHNQYSKRVESVIEEIFQDFAQAMANGSEDHEEPPNKVSKDKLEKASEKLRKAIQDWGKAQAQASLDNMDPAVFAKLV